jgi:hypothetical protein
MDKETERNWRKIADSAKHTMGGSGADTGLMMLEKGGAVAVFLMENGRQATPNSLLIALRLFQERINEMVDKAETGDIDIRHGSGSKAYIRDGEGGTYEPTDQFPL